MTTVFWIKTRSTKTPRGSIIRKASASSSVSYENTQGYRSSPMRRTWNVTNGVMARAPLPLVPCYAETRKKNEHSTIVRIQQKRLQHHT